MTRDEQIIVNAIQDNELPSAQAAAYRLLLRCAEQLSAMENLEKEEASGGRSAATPSPNQPSLDPRVEEISRGHDGKWRAYGRGDRGQMLHLGEAANLADLVGIDSELRRLEIERNSARARGDSCFRLLERCAGNVPAAMVRAFHQKFGVPIADKPAFPARDRMDLRVRLIAEEFCEFLAACGYDYTLDITIFAGEKAPGIEETEDVFFKTEKSLDFPNMIAAADGLADMQYTIEGAALEFGIPLAAVFAEVDRSNMTKTGDGGKITKGDGYEPPQIERILREHGWEG